ncbi:hypothetical protein DICVIV_10924 [Dictyocaulus viviparus]|uniref:Uncharacterized protein n=1 Tax=Dictyocaulus viviparus TaxID=29172 RepID=A0A0D8XL51_DICVI|nr:hypothetical protein DICVIV_10924 [Dictyocaulus viviparus]
MYNRTGLAPAPNVPNPRNAGRKKSNPTYESVIDVHVNNIPELADRHEKEIFPDVAHRSFFVDLCGNRALSSPIY